MDLYGLTDSVATFGAWVQGAGRWVADVSTWQLLALVLVGWLFLAPSAPRRLRSLMSTFQSVKVGSVELVANLDAPRETKQTLEGAFEELRSQARTAFDQLARSRRLRDRLEILVTQHVPAVLPSRPKTKHERWTIHVADISFDHRYYQLVDYYPSGGGRGRTFSTRYGIVGKAWRSDASEIQGDVSNDPATLIFDWGMMPEEAQRATVGKPSFLAVPLHGEGGLLLGVLFADSEDRHAFVPSGMPKDERRAVAGKLEEACRAAGIVEALENITTAASTIAPTVTLDEG